MPAPRSPDETREDSRPGQLAAVSRQVDAGSRVPDGVVMVETRLPKWNQRTQTYELPFKGRANFASARNFQMIEVSGARLPPPAPLCHVASVARARVRECPPSPAGSRADHRVAVEKLPRDQRGGRPAVALPPARRRDDRFARARRVSRGGTATAWCCYTASWRRTSSHSTSRARSRCSTPSPSPSPPPSGDDPGLDGAARDRTCCRTAPSRCRGSLDRRCGWSMTLTPSPCGVRCCPYMYRLQYLVSLLRGYCARLWFYIAWKPRSAAHDGDF